MKTCKAIALGVRLSGLLSFALAAPLQAATIATNGDVPANMSGPAGSESDPSDFIYDAYAKDWGTTALAVGSVANTEWLRLIIRNGSVIRAGANTFVGSGSRTDRVNVNHNQIVVTGSGSSLAITGNTRIGSDASHNSLIIEKQAVGYVSGILMVGSYNTGAYPVFTANALVVDGATFSVTNTLQVGYSTNCTYNTVAVRNGGAFLTFGGVSIGRFGAYGDGNVSGFGSVWTAANSTFRLGESATYAHHNTLTVQDQGLVKMSSASSIAVNQTAAGGSYVRFGGGFLAMNGDRTAAGLVDSKVQVWDGAGWIAGVKNSGGANQWTATYYADESVAEAATGYAGLGGYTVFTGGLTVTPPSPPSTATVLTIM